MPSLQLATWTYRHPIKGITSSKIHAMIRGTRTTKCSYILPANAYISQGYLAEVTCKRCAALVLNPKPNRVTSRNPLRRGNVRVPVAAYRQTETLEGM
jgi:hypothetical protein